MPRPRVLMVQRHGCIRVWKEALALKAQGYTVDLLSQQPTFGFNKFATVSIWNDVEPDLLKRAIEASPADVIHVHNEPDWIVHAARDATTRPVIFDVHDLESLRWKGVHGPNEDETKAFVAASGFVHVSPACAEYAEGFHGNGKPVSVLPCYQTDLYMTGPGWEELPESVSWDSIVYEGGLSEEQEVEELEGGQRKICMRSLQPVVSAFTSQGYNFYLYPASPSSGLVYENMGAVVSKPLIYPTMLRALRAYGWGFVGSPYSSPLLQAAMPNKLFEYLSQGVVPVLLNCGTAAEFVRREGLGVVLDGVDNLREQLVDGPAIRKRIVERRREFAMERHIGVVEQLYEAVA